MSEQQAQPSEFIPDGAGMPEITAGTYLREAREASGMHLATVAAALKVSVSKLEALEHDQFDLLPGAVFTRALASSVCRMLKLDPAPVLDRLPPLSPASFVPQDRGLNESFRPRNSGPAPSVWTQISRPAVLAGLVFLLGALVLIFLPSIRKDAAPEKASPDAVAGESAAQEALPALFPSPDATAIGAAALSGASAPDAASASPGRIAATVKDAATPVVPAPANGTTAPVNPASVATFRATGESWVKVTDANGVVVLNRTLNAGEQADVAGVLPLAAVVGRADVTQVQVRGQAFDLGAVAKNNVARFEVK